MKGKVGLVVGFGVGYVLGSRAGRERYEQIKRQWLKVWNATPVQKQVDRAVDFAKSQALAVPAAVWNGAKRVVKSAAADGTAQQRFDAAVATGKDAASDVADAAKETADVAKDTAKDAVRDAADDLKAGAKKAADSAKQGVDDANAAAKDAVDDAADTAKKTRSEK